MDTGSVNWTPGFDTVLHFSKGYLLAPYLSNYGMLALIIYDCTGKLINIELSNIPQGVIIPE